MTNKEILKKAIEKAIENGFDFYELVGIKDYIGIETSLARIGDLYNEYYSIIFSHDFAKAFWGEEEVNERGETHDDWRRADDFGWKSFGKKRWQYQLQQMVLEEEPIKYLEKFLKNNK